jgi:3-oxoacyl-[acyl-carrier-protein] synthase II
MLSGVNIQGAGWIGPRGHGRVRRNIRAEHADLGVLWKSDPVFARRAKSFGRFDVASRLAYYAAALALDDAGRGDPPAGEGLGLIGTGAAGCLASNLDYFKDYVSCGRTLARGNLFVYTLPTSPLAEVAIHFGLEGPLLYASSPERPLAAALETAAGMIRRGEAAGMLVIAAGAAEALCAVLSTQAGVPVEQAVEGSQADVVAAWERAFRTGDL